MALVGTSGAGKTTTAQLLMRFWDPDAGRITLNGADLRDYKLDELRRLIALVAQDTYLFNDTPARQHPDRPARRARGRAARPPSSTPRSASWSPPCPTGSTRRSASAAPACRGGQRQRVAIARAFLKDAPILILDEATSHLDAVNEQAVRRALDLLQADRTTIVIAHRLSTVRDADLIVVLDEGRVAETGTHAVAAGAGRALRAAGVAPACLGLRAGGILIRRRHRMFSHVTVGSNDIAKAKAFYDGVGKPLGLVRAWQTIPDGIGYGRQGGRPQLWIVRPLDKQAASVGNGITIGLEAADRAGGRRRLRGRHVSTAARTRARPACARTIIPTTTAPIVRDPDGNKVCIVCHKPA